METALMILGSGLIIASFEIQFRYWEMAKKYHEDCLNDSMEKIDTLYNKKKDMKVNIFLDELNKLLSNFSLNKISANFPNNLFIGFFVMGIYVIILGALYNELVAIYIFNPQIIITFLFLFGVLISLPLLKGLQSFIKLTKIS